MLLQPQKISVETQDGTEKEFIISKFPAVAGREILTQYPLSAAPKIGEYETNEELMLKIMRYVAVPFSRDEGGDLILENIDLVNNHVPDWECLARIEIAMIEYNCSFFVNGKGSSFLELITENMKGFITKILTDSLAELLQADTPRSES